MKRLITALVGAAMLAAFGCGGGDENGGGGNAAEYPVPLAVGNWWFSQSVNDTGSWDTTKIVGDTVYNGHDAFLAAGVYKDTDSLIIDTAIAYYADGFLVFHKTVVNDSFVMNMDMRMIKQDIAVGDTWTVFTYDTLIGGMSFTIKEWSTVVRQEDITVPAGSFNGCYVVLDTIQTLLSGNPIHTQEDTVWWAYGVGSVYSQSNVDTSQLVDYHIE